MILDKLVESTRIRVEQEKRDIPLKIVKEKALKMEKGNFSFEKVIAEDEISFICEIKKASPSKGVIAEEFPYIQIAKEYEGAGASCISVLTEPDYFKGDKKYLEEISRNVTIPLLRKDFVIDEYMIYDAKIHGASCVLLICSILGKKELEKYIQICDDLGMSALVEAHDEEEVNMAVDAGARMIGVNNRDLKTFTVDLANSERLRKKVPDHILFVAESGIRTGEDIQRLKKADVNGVLIGETLMRAENKKEMLQALKQ